MPPDFFDAGEQTMRLHLDPAATQTLDRESWMALTHALASSFWAQVQPVHEEPGPSGGPEITHRIWLPHASQAKAGMRLRKGARIFSIRTIHDPDESGRYLICHVTEE